MSFPVKFIITTEARRHGGVVLLIPRAAARNAF